MLKFCSDSERATQAFACRLAGLLQPGDVIAYQGGLGMGKTAFTRGLAQGLGDASQVSSPTFALVHEYTGCTPVLYHFDMYRVHTMDDLYSTGFFDYLETGAVLAIEWSENIEAALEDGVIHVKLEALGDTQRLITVWGGRFDGIDSLEPPAAPGEQKEEDGR